MEKMSAANLIILGLLLNKPMSAYEIAQIIETQVIGMLIKISSPTVYKNIKILHKEGCLTAEVVKEGEMPEKKVYTVTEEGKAYFFKLMEYYSLHFQRPVYEFNALLMNIDKVDKETGLKMLENIKEHFCRAKTWIVQHEQEADKKMFFAGRAIVKQYRMLFTTLVDWIEETIEEYRQEKEPGKYEIDPHVKHDMPDM